jgi:hypothetical protein
MKGCTIADSVQHFSARVIDTDLFFNDAGSLYESSQGQICA